MTDLENITKLIHDSLEKYAHECDYHMEQKVRQCFIIKIMSGFKVAVTVIPNDNMMCMVSFNCYVDKSLLPNNKHIKPGNVDVQCERDVQLTLIRSLDRLIRATHNRIINHLASKSWWSLSADERSERVNRLIEPLKDMVEYDVMSHTISYKGHVMHISEFDTEIKTQLSIGNCTVRDIRLDSAISIIDHYIL